MRSRLWCFYARASFFGWRDVVTYGVAMSYERKDNPLISYASRRAFQVFGEIKRRDREMIDRFEESVLVLNDPEWHEQYKRALRTVSQKWIVPDEDKIVNDSIVDNFIVNNRGRRRKGPGILGSNKI